MARKVSANPALGAPYGTPPRIIQMIPVGQGFVALSNQGNLYYGGFVTTHGGFLPPRVVWRKFPDIPQELLTFELCPELTEEQKQDIINPAPAPLKHTPPTGVVKKKKWRLRDWVAGGLVGTK